LIGTLKRQSRRWAERHAEFIGAEQDKSTGNLNLFLMPDDAEPLGRVAITIGETIYNLRSALDYIVYDIARIAQGSRSRARSSRSKRPRTPSSLGSLAKTRRGSRPVTFSGACRLGSASDPGTPTL
jgi:hypothetical protein